MNRREAIHYAAALLGATLSAPTLLAMSQPALSTASAVAPFLTEPQADVVARVADLILPRTTTPGALDVGVPAFIDLMLRDCYKKPVQAQFRAGVDELVRQDFLSQSADAQTATLTKLEAAAQAQLSATNPPFWQLIKELTLLGYFTSKAGISASFDYQPIPGTFKAIKIKPGQNDFMYGNQF